MDGPGHTAIFFRLDSLIRSLVAPSREQIVSHPTAPDERWSVPVSGCWRRADLAPTGGGQEWLICGCSLSLSPLQQEGSRRGSCWSSFYTVEKDVQTTRGSRQQCSHTSPMFNLGNIRLLSCTQQVFATWDFCFARCSLTGILFGSFIPFRCVLQMICILKMYLRIVTSQSKYRCNCKHVVLNSTNWL